MTEYPPNQRWNDTPPPMPRLRRRLTGGQRFVIVFLTLISIVLIAGIGLYAYALGLINLVRPIDYSGNPELQEIDIIETEVGATGGTNLPDAERQAIEKQADQIRAATPLLDDKGIYNILLIGSDTRGDARFGNSDTMIIASVNQQTKKVHLISLMRAMYVNIPGRGYSLLNGAFAWGGPKLLLQTIAETFKVKIDDYMYIDFDGFRKVIDLMGGVEVEINEAEQKYLAHLHPGAGLRVGKNQMDGTIALEFARARKLDSDFRRTERQRKIISAIISKTRTLSIGQLDRLARQFLPLIHSNRNGNSLLGLVAQAAEWRNYPISQLMLPLPGTEKRTYVRKMEVYTYDVAANLKALHDMLRD